MCGICGIFSFGDTAAVSVETLDDMCGLMRHRGPDDKGIFLGAGVGLAMTRLSIIDVAGGHQPIHNEDRTVWVVCNGEIYNFQELRKALTNQGHCFYTESDTEVLVHLYEEYGPDLLSKLRGMFALALWDDRNRTLLLARDRLGVKPLNYAIADGNIVFASETKSILKSGLVKSELDLDALDSYLSFKYVPAPKTILSGVKKLLPGHLLTCGPGIRPRVEQYWDIPFDNLLSSREEEICEELLALIRDAVKVRLVSDVPIGAFLSGGVDSSSVVALMSESSDRPIKTFSIGFRETEFNELPYAKQISERFGTDHHEFMVEKQGVEELLQELVWFFDEPFADASAIPTYYVSRLAREFATVILTGDGGDELFAGYTIFQGERFAQDFKAVPGPLRRALVEWPLALAGNLPATRGSYLVNRARRIVSSVNLSPEERFYSKMSVFGHATKERLKRYPPFGDSEYLDFNAELSSDLGSADPLLKIQYLTTKFYLSNDMLTKVDRMAMAHSLEARSPFLDHLLVEFCARIPMELKLKGYGKKYIFRRTMSGILPRNILNRKKQGFSVPLSYWFKKDLFDYAWEMLLSAGSSSRQFFDAEAIRGILESHRGGTADCAEQIWILLNFEVWHRMFVQGRLTRHSPRLIGP